MILFEGPNKKNQFKKRIDKTLERKKIIFFLLVFTLPILAFLPFKFDWVSTGFNANGDYKSVAKIIVEGGSGSGFLISPRKILTAKHVVERYSIGDDIEVVFEKADPLITAQRAKLIFVPSSDEDFAVLELSQPVNNLNPFSLGDDKSIVLNDEVNIIGYPGGLFSSARSQIINDAVDDESLFVLAGGAWPGNSGGPIINSKTHEVIGILIAGFEEKYKGMVLGLKISKIKNNPELLKAKINLSN